MTSTVSRFGYIYLLV